MARMVQMITYDRVGRETLPVEVQGSLTVPNIVASASKKFKTVARKSRVYDGATGAELVGEGPHEVAQGAFLVLSGKDGWKGAARLSAAHLARTADRKCEGAPLVQASVVAEDSSSCGAGLAEAAESDRANGVVLCWKETQDNGYLSNWAKSPFVIDGVRYNCAEQWIMACKARVCGDEAVLARIMLAQSPRKQKGLGRSLDQKMVQRCWRLPEKWAAQYRGARAKFQQSDALAQRLLRTGLKRIAEASPSDRVFGIGLAPSDPLAQDPSNWRGSNLLGRALERVREELRRHLLAGGALADVPEAARVPALSLEGEEEGEESGEDAPEAAGVPAASLEGEEEDEESGGEDEEEEEDDERDGAEETPPSDCEAGPPT